MDINIDAPEEVIEEEKPSIMKKIFIILIAIFLLFLFLTYLLTSPTVWGILQGLAESSILEGNQFKVGEKAIVFSNNSYNKLLEVYDKNPNIEFKVCLTGGIIDKNYTIYSVYEPKMLSQSYTSVVSEKCPKETIIALHNHPSRFCIPSKKDLENLKVLKGDNPNAMIAIMCTKNRINFYK